MRDTVQGMAAGRVRGLLVYQVVLAFGVAVKFGGVSLPDEYSELAEMGDAALQYRDQVSERTAKRFVYMRRLVVGRSSRIGFG